MEINNCQISKERPFHVLNAWEGLSFGSQDVIFLYMQLIISTYSEHR